MLFRSPSPLGLPMAIASRTFPLAQKLGISGRKPVRSFEEVLWLTGALAYNYEQTSVEILCDILENQHIDAVYSEFSLPAIIAARLCRIPVYGSFSYTTQVSYASDPSKAVGIRKLLNKLGLPQVESSLELFDWLDRRFVPSCRLLEPIKDEKTSFVGFLKEPPQISKTHKNCLVVYLGSGSVSQNTIEHTVRTAFKDLNLEVYVASTSKTYTESNLHFAPCFDFSELLPHAKCFIHHGGQNSTMDALAYGVPQIIAPGRVFERIYNAESIERAGAGLKANRFEAKTLLDTLCQISSDRRFEEAAGILRDDLSSLGGAASIARSL